LQTVKAISSSLGLLGCLGLAAAAARIGGNAPQIRPLTAVAATSSSQWSLIGPAPISQGGESYAGRVTAMAVDPRNSDVVFLGGAEGGVWKTTDAGETWTPLTDNQPSLAMGALILDPSNPEIVYAGTGLVFEGKYGAGLLKSTDGGSTWANIPVPFGSGGGDIAALTINPSNSQILLAAAPGRGIYRSADAGQTWTNEFPGSYPTELFFDPTDGNTAYAAVGLACCGTPKGVFKSQDGGATWNPMNGTGLNVLPSANLGRIEIAISPSSPLVLYAGIENSTDGMLLGIFKTVDGGANWTAFPSAPNYCVTHCGYDNVIRVDPTNANIVVLGGIDIYRSLDGGNSWSDIRTGADGVAVHVDHHALAFSSDGSILYVGNDGGAWRTDNLSGPVTWTNLNATLAITQFNFGLSVHPSNPAILLAGGPDNGTSLFSGGLTWQEVVCLDGGATAIDPANPNNVYAACAGTRILKSTSGGTGAWTLANSGIIPDDLPSAYGQLVIDPSMPQNLYFGTHRIYQTSDGASSWAIISPDLTNGSGTITAIAVAPADSNTVYAGTSNGLVWLTTNASAGTGARWMNVGHFATDRPVTQIVVDPSASTSAYAVLGGFSRDADTQGHVLRTVGGGTWVDVSGNLPNLPAHDMVIDPDLRNTWYLATDSGVFSTVDGGNTWFQLSAGLPNVTVSSLRLFHPARILFAATHGRSTWKLQLPDFSMSPLALGFGSQPLNTTSAAQTETINNGTANLTILKVTIGGPNSSDFAESTDSCTGVTVTPGGTCTVGVTFTPSATGSRSASLSFTDSASNSPQNISLSGTGTGPVASLSAPLTFSPQWVGATSNSQTVTLTNTGNGNLTFKSIMVTGAFAITTSGTTCWTSNPVAAAATCTVAVTFTPTAAGTASGNLSFVDNAANSPQTITLSGMAQDFLFAPPSGSTTSATVAPGQSATYTLSVTGEGGFNQSVSFGCTGAPSEAACTVSPNAVTAGSSATNVTVTVTTTAASISAPRSRPLPPVRPLSPGLKTLLILALVLAAIAWAMRRRNQVGLSRWRSALVALASGSVLTLALARCGGGVGGGGNPGTAAGSYALTVTGTALSGSATLTHNLTLTLNVD